MGQTCGGRCSKQQINESEILIAQPEQYDGNPFILLEQICEHPRPKLYKPFNVNIVSDPNSEFTLVKCELQDFSFSLTEMEKRLANQRSSNPFVTLVHHWEFQDASLMQKRVVVWADDLKKSLAYILRNSKITKDDVWLLIDCISEAMYQMQLKKRYICGVSSTRVFEVTTPFQKKVYKVHDWTFNENKKYFYHQWMENYKEHHIIDHKSLMRTLPSPSILNLVKNGVHLPNINYFKLDVFSFGLLVLQCINSPRILMQLYNNWELSMDIEYLNFLKKTAPEQLREFLQLVLEVDDNVRVDWIQLKSYLDQNLQGKRLMEQQKIDDFYYDKIFNIKDKLLMAPKESNITQNLLSEPLKQELVDSDVKNTNKQSEPPEANIYTVDGLFLQKVEQVNHVEDIPFEEQYNLTLFPQDQDEFLSVCQNFDPICSSAVIEPTYAQIKEDGDGTVISYKENKNLKNEEKKFYIGQMKDKLKHGNGEIVTVSQKLVTRGYFSKDLLNGHGLVYNINSKEFKPSLFDRGHHDIELKGQKWESYEGMFQEGKRNGQGNVVFTNNAKFKGLYTNDKANGNGIFTYADGNQIIGIWINDAYQKPE